MTNFLLTYVGVTKNIITWDCTQFKKQIGKKL